MFASPVTDTSTIHYGTDPLHGFHLATAYIPLSRDSPLRCKSPRDLHLHKVVEAARLEFKAWSISFRRYARQRLTLRFFAGDALAFCNALESKRTSSEAVSANIYRELYGLEPLVLDSEDYAPNGKAPVSFNIPEGTTLVSWR
jgi:hypothetical protein